VTISWYLAGNIKCSSNGCNRDKDLRCIYCGSKAQHNPVVQNEVDDEDISETVKRYQKLVTAIIMGGYEDIFNFHDFIIKHGISKEAIKAKVKEMLKREIEFTFSHEAVRKVLRERFDRDINFVDTENEEYMGRFNSLWNNYLSAKVFFFSPFKFDSGGGRPDYPSLMMFYRSFLVGSEKDASVISMLQKIKDVSSFIDTLIDVTVNVSIIRARRSMFDEKGHHNMLQNQPGA